MGKTITTWTLSLPLILLLLFCSPARPMTIKEAVSYAMEHNRDILTVREQITERKGQVLEARSDALPQLNLNMNSYRVRDPGFLNSTFGQQILHGGGGSSDFPIPIEAILPRPQTFYELVMNVSQPIFTWGKVSNAVSLAKLGIQDVNLSLESARQNVAYQVSSAYYDVLVAVETIAMYEKALETQKRYLQQTRDFLEVGDGTRLDILRAQSQLATTEPELLMARHSLVQAEKTLNFLLGRPLEEPLSTSPVEAVEDFEAPPLDSVVQVAVLNRPDLRQLNVEVDMYDKTVNVFKADFRPRMDLNGHYGFSTIRTGDIFDRNFESWRVSLVLSVPVFDGFKNRGVVMQYRSQKNRKEIESQKLAEQIRLQALQTLDACTSAAEVYRGREISLESSEEEERVTADQFDQGLVTLYELLDSNRRALLARSRSIDGRYGLLRQIADLKRAMGIPVDELF